jgi:hypothetical protein
MVKVDWDGLEKLARGWRGAKKTSASFPSRAHVEYRAELEKAGGDRCNCLTCTAVRKETARGVLP